MNNSGVTALRVKAWRKGIGEEIFKVERFIYLFILRSRGADVNELKYMGTMHESFSHALARRHYHGLWRCRAGDPVK